MKNYLKKMSKSRVNTGVRRASRLEGKAQNAGNRSPRKQSKRK